MCQDLVNVWEKPHDLKMFCYHQIYKNGGNVISTLLAMPRGGK